jgi:crossover junction endodeoxyribonuclease RuvC
MISLAKKSGRKFTSLGIDPSTVATGVVMLEESGTRLPTVLWQDEIKVAGAGIQRNATIVSIIMKAILANKPDIIVMEGYSLNMKNAASVIPLVELGGMLRFMLKIEGLKWFDPRAGQLKQFATGKGNSPKDVVMMHVFKRWEFESATNNIGDAYVCAAMGLARAERLPGITLPMKCIVGEMKENMN